MPEDRWSGLARPAMAMLALLATDAGMTAASAQTRPDARPQAMRCAAQLPAPVAAKRQAIKDVAARRDWPALAKLAAPGFQWGGYNEGDPVPFWRELAGRGDDPAVPLLAILDMPCVVVRADGKTVYWWPSAGSFDWKALTPAEKSALQALYGAKIDQYWLEGRNKGYYVGWSVGIDPQGNWKSFTIGD